jgi:radical SAM protein with 4Fe4S-binding SPASM domain
MQYLLQSLARVPQECVWEVTTACNLRCIHCECEAGPRDLDELTTEEALRLCDDLAELGVERVSLSGGEPLIRSDWHLLAARLKQHDVRVFLVTNGLLFDREVARRCVDLGVDWVSVSIDGLMATHDSIRRHPGRGGVSSFRRAFEALTLSRASGLCTGVLTHINGRNLDELDGLYELLSVVPIQGWQLQLGCPQGRMRATEPGYLIAPEQLPRIADFVAAHRGGPFPITCADDLGYYTERESTLRPLDGEHFPFWVGCYAGILGVAIESNGRVKGCPSLPSSMAEGSVRERSLREIWEDPESFPYNRRWDPRKLRGFCRRCEFRRLCRAGCTSFALASTGSIYENRHCLYRVQQCQR